MLRGRLQSGGQVAAARDNSDPSIIFPRTLSQKIDPSHSGARRRRGRYSNIFHILLRAILMKILGLSALYHDSAAALCIDGEIIAAAQEERFTRVKNDASFPKQAAAYCLSAIGNPPLDPEQLDAVVYYDNPYLTLDRWLENCVSLGDQSMPMVEKGFEAMFSQKMWIHETVRREVGLGKHGKLLAVEHHISHAASAYLPSPFEDSAILVVDGVGEWATTSILTGRHSRIEVLKQLNYPHSLGLLYSAFTYFCGFKVNSGEYKLMGLAPYGNPSYYDRIRDELIDIKEDGSFRLNLEYFSFHRGNSTISPKFSDLFDGEARYPETRISRREVDLAASIQKVTEEVMLKLAHHAKELTNSKNLCMAGGVALNCVANGKIVSANIFDRVWIQPASGDAGGAIGAALYAEHTLYESPRSLEIGDKMKGSFLGPKYDSGDIQQTLTAKKAKFKQVPDLHTRCKIIAKMLAEDKVVGFFQGRMEFGPRSLGARSILASPLSPLMQRILNQKVKFRESFRPFAPAVTEDEYSKYFELQDISPYMLVTTPINQDLRLSGSKLETDSCNSDNIDLIELLSQPRSILPAITHLDYSARVQTVNSETNEVFHRLLTEFAELTGFHVLINTSFNVRGEPIVCRPEDAYNCFMRTGIDALMLEDYILLKHEQSPLTESLQEGGHYELD